MVAGHAADLSTNDAIAYAIDWPKNTPAITIPLEFRGGIPFVTCQLNGKTARLMVDTGVSTIFLYESRLNDLGLQVTGKHHREIRSVTDSIPDINYSSKFTLEFAGGLRVKVSAALCLPESSQQFASDVDGFLDLLLLQFLNATIDYGRETITFTIKKPSRQLGGLPTSSAAAQSLPDDLSTKDGFVVSVADWPLAAPSITIPLHFRDKLLPFVTGKINGRTVRLMVDTGQSLVALYENRLNDLGLKVIGKLHENGRSATGAIPEPNCSSKFTLKFEDSLQIQMPTAECLPESFMLLGSDVDGYLGGELLRILNGVIDLGSGTITFPRPKRVDKGDPTAASH